MTEAEFEIYVNKNDDKTITISFSKPLLVNWLLLLCFCFDGVSFSYNTKGKKAYLVSLTCYPWQWAAYLKEWGVMCNISKEKVKEAQRRFEECLKEKV
jgi:hypothetical protein